MAEIVHLPGRDPWTINREAQGRGNRVEVRGNKLVEVIPGKRREKSPNYYRGGDGPSAA